MPRKTVFTIEMEDDHGELAQLLETFEIMPYTAAILEQAGFVSLKSLALLSEEAVNSETGF